MTTQSPRAPAADGGWIEWDGGDCPIDPDADVQVSFRADRRTDEAPVRAGNMRWSHWHKLGFAGGGDIVAYRLPSPPKALP